ncbi:hypothetical protein [Paenibacillus lautus]|uniref:hypothetical protein n=1 Tax=Paenibacillus lautus TaxID=1401 RepID=UPI00209ECE65|nr:hypothetical protein [Paenibacillus lautus]
MHNPLHAFMVNLTLHPKQSRDLPVSITKFMLTTEFTNLLYHVIFTWVFVGVFPAIVGEARKGSMQTLELTLTSRDSTHSTTAFGDTSFAFLHAFLADLVVA